MSDDKEERTQKLIQALSENVKETEKNISEASEKMRRRQQDTYKHYAPARQLLESVRATRTAFKKRVEETLELIEKETDELRELHEANAEAIRELQRAEEALRERPVDADDSPVMVSVRAFAAMLPFAAFALINVLANNN